MEYLFGFLLFAAPLVLLGFLCERCPAARQVADKLADRIGMGDEPEWMR